MNNHSRLVPLAAILLAGAVVVAGISTPARAEQTVSGTVLNAAGQPVDGAEVIVSTAKLPAYPNLTADERDEPRAGAATALTDKAGRFTVALPEGAGLLSINHPTAGYAEVKPAALDGANAEPVKLEPWCRVEGTVKIGAKPAPAGTKVSLGVFFAIPNVPRVVYGYDTATDGQGRYVLDRVPAGVNQIKVKLSKTGSALEQYVGAEPGKTLRFDIGGKGRPVVGKVALGGYDINELTNPDPKARQLLSNSHFRRDVPWPRPPYGGGTSPEEREEILSTWRRTPEALEQWKDQYRCTIEFQPDGSFRFDDVPPGKYKLTLTVYQASGNVIGNSVTDVEVPETPAVPTDQPLDLGEHKFGTEGAAGAENGL